jgi:hypothetical protein
VAKKAKSRANSPGKKADSMDTVWVSPRYSLKGPSGERAWENRPGGPPNSGKFLELADIAMGIKKASPRHKRTSQIYSSTVKTEPYLKMKLPS